MSFVKYWELIADNLSKAGWSWGCVVSMDSEGRDIFIVDAHQQRKAISLCMRTKKLTVFL